MPTNTITSADAVFILSIPGVFSTGQALQGFSADDMFSTDTIDPVELQMGADGILAAGWIPVMRKQSISLQASSLSVSIFETWAAEQDRAKQLFPASGVIILNSTSMQYTMSNGFLSTFSPVPNAKKVLQPRLFGITWQTITGAPSA